MWRRAGPGDIAAASRGGHRRFAPPPPQPPRSLSVLSRWGSWLSPAGFRRPLLAREFGETAGASPQQNGVGLNRGHRRAAAPRRRPSPTPGRVARLPAGCLPGPCLPSSRPAGHLASPPACPSTLPTCPAAPLACFCLPPPPASCLLPRLPVPLLGGEAGVSVKPIRLLLRFKVCWSKLGSDERESPDARFDARCDFLGLFWFLS